MFITPVIPSANASFINDISFKSFISSTLVNVGIIGVFTRRVYRYFIYYILLKMGYRLHIQKLNTLFPK